MELSLRFLGYLTLLCYLLHITKAVKPVFQASSPGTITEGLPPGTSYYKFIATDASPGHVVTYSLESKALEWFNINSASGEATVKKTIDRESMGSLFRYKVYASDGTNTAEANVNQQIRDINDNPPVFTNLPKTIDIKEDSPVGSLVFTVSATDADAKPADAIKFFIETGNEEGRFEFPNDAEGEINLKKSLDYDDGAKQFVLRIIAKNTLSSPYLNSTSVLTINVLDVDDLGPKFEKNLYEATVVKDSLPGTVVTTVQAKDRDSFNDTVEYKIYQETNQGNVYKVNNNTGEITVNGPLTIGTQLLVVTATSTKNPSTFTVVKIKVASMLNMSYTVTVVEGQSNVVIFDLEPAEEFYNTTGGTFSIISSAQSSLFSIDGKNLKVGATPLDRETQEQYQLNIALDKDSTRKGMVMVTILVLDVNDNSPVFQGSTPYNTNIKEDAGIGAKIVKVLATDSDSGLNGTVKYAITAGNDQGLFSIDNTTGQISLSGSLDRETTAQYTLTIQAYDGGSPPKTNTTTVIISVQDVNDNSPVINQTFFTKVLSEWATNGTEVAVVSATDADSGDNGKITYVIQEGADGKFVIDSNSGVLTTTGGLSYTTKPKYTIIVKARDHGSSPRSATAVVSVSVEPKTNKTYTVQVAENRQNEVVMGLVVVEQDYNITGASFSILDGNSDGHFEINAKDLKVGTKPLDREIKDKYNIRVTLSKDDKVRGVAMIVVHVLDMNDNAPAFQGSIPYNIDVKEDQKIGQSISKVTATDSDSGANGTVRYAITAGNEQGYFSIDNSTGEITISKLLDRETTAQYTLTIQAYDGGSPPMTNTTTVIINVQDVNDNSPVFTSRITNVTVPENTANGFAITQVIANDSDIGENSRISYSIVEGSFAKFVIDRTTGVIKATGGLSFKERPKYTLIIDASDNGQSPRSGSALVYITITSAGVNLYPPGFTKTDYLGGVYKDTSDDQVILTVSATDADSGENGEVIYELTKNPAEYLFHLETVSGRLHSANSFVEKEGELYILEAKAKDKATPPLSSAKANLCVFVLRESHSLVITAGVPQEFILKNIEEFRSVLDDLTGGKAFIKSVRPKEGEENSSEIIVNAVKNCSKTELTSAQITKSLEGKQTDIDDKYKKWDIKTYEPPKTGKRISTGGGLSAIVGAMICLALLIGVGGIIMIVILIKKRRERERIRKNARVTFSDEAHYINIDGNMPVSKLRHVESAQEAHEGFVNMNDETSSVGSEEVQTTPDVMNYINDAYHNDEHDEHGQEEEFFDTNDRVNFGTFFPPPPTEPPPPVPDSDTGSLASEEVSINSDDDDPDYINAVLPPHRDFADNSIPEVNEENNADSPTHSHTDSTSQLINPSSYKDTHDPTIGFEALRRSSNPELTTEL